MVKAHIKKVICYITRGDKLLVFRHVDYSYEQVGIQVPAGTVRDGEDSQQAALREAIEETGLKEFSSIRFLGALDYDMTPHRFEIHERSFFHLTFDDDTPERWASREDHDGLDPPTRFECFWIDLSYGHILQSGQGAFLYALFEDGGV